VRRYLVSWSVLFRILAFICFVVAAAVSVQARWPRINLIGAGLALWVLSTFEFAQDEIG
jgi:hypothetical protein